MNRPAFPLHLNANPRSAMRASHLKLGVQSQVEDGGGSDWTDFKVKNKWKLGPHPHIAGHLGYPKWPRS